MANKIGVRGGVGAYSGMLCNIRAVKNVAVVSA